MERDFLHTLTLIKIRLQKISLKITYMYAIKKQSKQRIMRQERFVLLNQKIKYHHKKIVICVKSIRKNSFNYNEIIGCN